MEWGREKNHSADENDENEHVTRTPLAERICAIGLPYTVVALMFYVDDHVQRIFAKLYIDCVYDFRLCFSQENKKQKFRAREQIYYMCLHTSGTVEHWPVSIARHQTHRGTHRHKLVLKLMAGMFGAVRHCFAVHLILLCNCIAEWCLITCYITNTTINYHLTAYRGQSAS